MLLSKKDKRNIKERVQVYIDGGNFFHLVLKKLKTDPLSFHIEDFVDFLIDGRTVSNYGKRYYVGTIREQQNNPKSIKAMSEQTKLFTILNSYGWELKTSKLRIRDEEIIIDRRVKNYQTIKQKGIRKIQYTTMREKGIDVKLATDLIAGAVDDRYDTAIVVSSDGDLVPAIDWVRKCRDKRVEYIGFSIPDKDEPKKNTRPLQTMIQRTDVQRILTETDLRKYIKPFLQQK